MKQILIIGSRSSGSKNDPAIFQKTLSAVGSATLAYWEDLMFSISTDNVTVTDGNSDLFASKPDLVICLGWYKNGKQSIYRDVAYSLALILEDKGIEFWNSEMGQQRSTTKLSSSVQLALAGVPIVPTTFSLSKDRLFNSLKTPFIAKAAAASRGSHNYLVEDDDTTRRLIEDDIFYILQPFVPNAYDLRLICMGGNVQLVLERRRSTKSESHMNNTSQGGSATWLAANSMSSDLLTIANKICKITKRELAGIDMIPDESSSIGYSCLEVNAIPQLTSGHDVEMKLESLVQAVKNS